jgi:hypothetical protein
VKILVSNLLKGPHTLTVFDGRPLMDIFGPKRDVGDWTELRNEQIYEVYSPTSLISVTKSRRV